MNNPLVSILLPAYNAAPYIKEAIDSLLNQTYENFELLIADDASTDSTRAIIDSYKDSRVKTFHNSVNLKKPRTVQNLFENCTGAIITIHDADDISHPTRFEEIIPIFKKRTDIYMCGHEIERVTEKGTPLGLFRKKATDSGKIIEMMRRDNTDGDASVFIRREVLEQLGVIYRPYFQNNMDYDLALRIIENYKTTNLQKSLYYYRNVPNSISKGIPTYHKLITQQVTQHLAKERESGKKDALEREDLAFIKDLERKFSQPYLLDKTLHLRKMAEFFMYVKMNKSAINYMYLAIRQEPLKFSNWRTLQYCIRKTLFKF
ncbi:glycosyltransferase family 2 protein [Reichenbachiella agariperforans]|uniref:glycosyltransferase family 2 protein n=1 Tax=Reichenbachiella agariperforans TaxID=156994 RepID=UPI001C0987FC|nr:glycosyltransferase family 2 protein [Reichenbachiella agariperforans]MBU2915200.1 glycosyltransferase [Reichenbachiella agariperforans]